MSIRIQNGFEHYLVNWYISQDYIYTANWSRTNKGASVCQQLTSTSSIVPIEIEYGIVPYTCVQIFALNANTHGEGRWRSAACWVMQVIWAQRLNGRVAFSEHLANNFRFRADEAQNLFEQQQCGYTAHCRLRVWVNTIKCATCRSCFEMDIHSMCGNSRSMLSR